MKKALIESISVFKRINYNPKLNTRSNKMGREMTIAEKIIWFNILSGRKLMNYKLPL